MVEYTKSRMLRQTCPRQCRNGAGSIEAPCSRDEVHGPSKDAHGMVVRPSSMRMRSRGRLSCRRSLRCCCPAVDRPYR
ncbi:hypothetical protein BD309DRAFT_961871 [Dichomitus squalens]|uniref:Uncharacterized protein n=1 Tax=Dichomitus squalens TaxID=114155 RepID=A0A4Q9MB87_9APHY|nr:hypothetical protein BD311DRAFT_766547 [Dichomitus squalens]TBU42897.1 hypothetical protein BD309DRAFT_961871 [Dichomitus squalens]TBU54124.1 hypothetical protein BD310DRAFT_936560 [Dichomitus squalens]